MWNIKNAHQNLLSHFNYSKKFHVDHKINYGYVHEFSDFKLVHFISIACTLSYILYKGGRCCVLVLRKDNSMITLVSSVAINYYCTVDYSPYLNCIIVIKACNL